MHPSIAKFGIDVALWSLAGLLAFLIRTGSDSPAYIPTAIAYVLAGVPLKAVLIYLFGTHRFVWAKVSVPDLFNIAKTVALGTLGMAAVSFMLDISPSVPRMIPFLDGLMALCLMSGFRFAVRYIDERNRRMQFEGNQGRVLVVGTGPDGVLIAREMQRNPEAGLNPVGFLTQDPVLRGERLGGLPVLGMLEDLPGAARSSGASEVLIAIPGASGAVVRKVVDLARQAGLKYRIIPDFGKILSGAAAISQIREVNLEDLLRRDPAKLNLEEISGYLENRVVLITGAGGSIGSEMVRQVCRFKPKMLVLVGRGENSIYHIENELKRNWPNIPFRSFVADVRRMVKLEQVFEATHPQVVFHAAAHKHVPAMEANPDEAIFNNVGGTFNMVRLALKFGVERFVNISTDKAVNPTSVMGASKRVAEYVVQWAAERATPEQGFVSVRFGNVLGSRGSVVPLFQQQIKQGGPVTVTHPEMTRYFMTIPEAAQLVLQAGGLGANGSVYVLDMGQPVKIVDLAHDVIRLSGFEPEVDIEVKFTGMRPGEKLYEELLTDEEGTQSTRHQQIFVAEPPSFQETLSANLEDLFAAARDADGERIKGMLKKLIPTFSYQAKEKQTSGS